MRLRVESLTPHYGQNDSGARIFLMTVVSRQRSPTEPRAPRFGVTL